MKTAATQDADRFFAKPRFNDPLYVSAILQLTQLLVRQYAALKRTGRHVEILREEYAEIIENHGELLGDRPPAFVFPSRGVVPRGEDVVELRMLDNVADRTRFLANILQTYVQWLGENGQKDRFRERVASLTLSLKRILHEEASRAA